MRKVPIDKGQEGRRLVAAAYAGSWRTKEQSRESARKRADEWLNGTLDESEAEEMDRGIRRVVAALVVVEHRELDYTYAAKVIRDLCRGTCAVSDGWRARLEALAACGQAMDESGGAS
jgi:hypothetical protein